ncbi:mechanosensitive ion channel family protein [Sedimentitalea todarodis]|uniref:Mechanosensitive ion channel family protein n=1 Tax=Sedimentitalea todarodis TaxID=1631240 RepID=A0ABU3VBT4_9RHOB|nr:mechanosensitive ion channel family protein [Sedimentitalea todarodis]MDU9003636.1 mechanosensitive ion channel family protein [Sedimentitalea todarodis]
MGLFSRVCAALIALIVFHTMATGAQSQALAAINGGSGSSEETTSTDLPEPLSQDAVREMVARMSDDQVRDMLLDRLDAVAAAESQTGTPAGTGVFSQLNTLWVAFYSNPLDAIVKLPTLVQKQGEAIGGFVREFGGASGVFKMLGLTAIALAVGFGVEFLAQRLTKRWQRSLPPSDSATLRESLSFLFRRFMREIFGLIIFYFTIRMVGRALLDTQQLIFVAPMVTYLIWWPRLGAAVSRFVLAPKKPSLRLVSLDDHWAAFLHKNLVGLILLSGFTIFAVGFNMNAGHSLAETRIGFWLDSAVYLYIIFIAWSARDGLVELMRGSDPDRTEYDELVARCYPYYVIAVAAGMWVLVTILAGLGNVELLLKGAHYTTMFWLIIAPTLDMLVRGLVRHLVPPMIGQGPLAEKAYRSTKRSYIRIGRVLIAGIVLVLIANSWDMNIADFTSQRQGFGSRLIEFLMTLAVGYIVFEVVSLWINRKLAKEQTSSDPVSEDVAVGEGGGAGGSRLATVLPLLRLSALTGIVIIFTLLAVGTLGIDITPLLAGAGILGLAIGFGAQKLVTDIVSGVFFLIDDAFRVGEYVDVGGTMGTVEKISIRSMQLRHHRGNVHTIPYGSVEKVTNFSRDWVIMKLMFTVPFDTDPNKVKKIFKKIGAEMLADPLFENDFLEPFKSQGVLQFDDVGIVMRGKFMAKPGTQFTIRKEIYNRVRKEFADNGIEFARREVRVAIPGLDHDDELTDVEKQAIAAGAGGAVQAQVEQQSEKK